MKIKIKSLLAALLCCSIGVSMTGCNNDQQSAASSESSSAEASKSSTTKVEKLTFATFNAWWNKENLQTGIKMYEEKTGIKIDAQIYPDDQFQNIIMAKLATSDVPDVFAFNCSLKTFGTDQLAPLTGDWVSKLDKDTAVVKGYARTGDDNIYVAPFGPCGFQGIMYNKDVLKKAGVTLPLKTYNEFVQACEKVKNIGVTPIYVPNGDAWPAQILMYGGSNFIAAQNKDFASKMFAHETNYKDSTALVDMLNRIKGFKDKGYINEDLASATVVMAEEAMINDKAAFAPAGNWLYDDYAKNYADQAEKIGMMPFNMGDDASNLGVLKTNSSNGLYIPSASKQMDAAMEFVDFIMSEDVMKAMYDKVPGANELGIDTNGSPWDIEMQGYLDSGDAVQGYMFADAIANVQPGSSFDQGDLAMAGQTLLSGKDPIAVLEELQNDSNKKNKASGLKGW